MKNHSLLREFLEFKQLMAADDLFKKKEEKKEEKKPWHASIKPNTFFKIYLILVILYPVIGKLYTMLLLKLWQ